MSEGFPLLTQRTLPIKSTLVELEGFLNGITDKRWFQERGCHFWDQWGNPRKVIERQYRENDFTEESRKRFQLEESDLGPVYGAMWRNFGDKDQLVTILKSLKEDPNDRRMLCSAWNPEYFSEMALPPCHVLFHLTVIDNELSLDWYQRSVDTCCGLPQNITCYGTLLLLFCKYSGLKAGKLSGFLSDVHIYENHINQIKEQITRPTNKLPNMEITVDPFYISRNFNNVVWTHKDIVLYAYKAGEKIKYEVAI